MVLDEIETLKLVENISIPPAPFVLKRLHQELQKDEPVLADISDIISQDVGISALVLRTINSSFFGMGVKIRSIQHATSLLGINFTINIIAGLSLRRTFEESRGDTPPNHWESPANVAMLAVNIARVFSFDELDEMYLLGLFHNAGHALLSQRFSDYNEFFVKNINRENEIITGIEDQHYNTDHALLGFLLASSWGLERDLKEVIRDHHNTNELLTEKNGEICKKGRMLAILKMAEHIDKLFWGMKPDREWDQIENLVLDYLGMSKPDFDDLQADMLEKLISG